MNYKTRCMVTALAVGLAATAGVMEAEAADWSDVLHPYDHQNVLEGNSIAFIDVTRKQASYDGETAPGQRFSGGLYVQCRNSPLHGWGGGTYTTSVSYSYRCPGIRRLQTAQGWIQDR